MDAKIRADFKTDLKIDLRAEDWRTTGLRSSTKKILERITQKRYNPKIRYILLFGSEARGEAVLTSDVDIALVSDEPLTHSERLEFKEIFDVRLFPEVNGLFPEINVINTLTADLATERFTDVSYHIKREGLVIYER